MRYKFPILYTTCILLASACLAQLPGSEQQLTRSEIKTLIDSLDHVMSTSYLYPEKASLMISGVRRSFRSGAYNSVKSKGALAHQMEVDLQQTYKDRHLEIAYNPQLAGSLEIEIPDTAGNRLAYERDLGAARDANFAYKKAEILQGNIGYVRWDGFFGFIDEAKPTINGAFQFLGNTKALIIDMRNNGGGSPEMVLQVQSYFFRQKTPMNHIIGRNGDTLMRWADPGKTDFKLNMPVYILTSKNTFSGAEDFCYGLKYAGRATIVGDTTRGGAHVTKPFSIGQGFVAFIPGQRAFNAVTKTDWDSTGVWPDAAVPSELALIQAQGMIYENLLSKTNDEKEKKVLRWMLANNGNRLLLARQNLTDSVQPTKQELSRYCGEYYTLEPNPIKSIFIVLKGSHLFRHLDNGSDDILLVPVAPGKFVYDDDTGRAIEFIRDAAEGSVKMSLDTPNGTSTRTKK